MPTPPKVEIIRNPTDEQLAQAPVIIAKNELETKDLPNPMLVFLNRYTFNGTVRPKSSPLMLVNTKPIIASVGI
jgi:hypothetical protein